jgi:hypothetical protein
MILLAVVLAVAGLGGYAVLHYEAQHTHDQAIIAQHDLDNVKAQAASLTQLTQQQEVVIQQQRNALDAQTKALESAIANRNITVIQQQKKDAVLPPTELAARLAQLSGSTVNDVKAQADGSIALSQPASVQVTAKLEEVPVLEANLGDLQKEIANDKGIIAGQDTDLKLKAQIIAQDAVVLKSQIDADQKELKAVKADARKSKVKWFIAGYVAGFVTRVLTVK